MTHHKNLNVKLSNSQLHLLLKLKSGIKYGIEVILNISIILIRNSDAETNFPYKFSLTDTQVSKIGELLQIVY